MKVFGPTFLQWVLTTPRANLDPIVAVGDAFGIIAVMATQIIASGHGDVLMCGRFSLRTPNKAVVQAFGLAEGPDLKPRYNIAPTQQVAAIRLDRETGTRQLSLFRWGLVPSWADDPSIG